MQTGCMRMDGFWGWWSSCMLVFNDESSMFWFGFHLESPYAKWYKWASDIFFFSIFLMGLCRADMRTIDACACFRYSFVYRFEDEAFLEGVVTCLYCKYFVANFHISNAYTALKICALYESPCYGWYGAKGTINFCCLCEFSLVGEAPSRFSPFLLLCSYFSLTLFVFYVFLYVTTVLKQRYKKNMKMKWSMMGGDTIGV